MGDCFLAACFLFKCTVVFRIMHADFLLEKTISLFALMGFSMDLSLNIKLKGARISQDEKQRRRLRRAGRWPKTGKDGFDSAKNQSEYANSNLLKTGQRQWNRP